MNILNNEINNIYIIYEKEHSRDIRKDNSQDIRKVNSQADTEVIE